ncbi:MAG: chorismate mutase [Euryarchaeota archaeon]|nr:chorismate mutase [Euryarchaeota archaeon]MDE1835383.1 chorismate mutase [Euryarchaeota archaeon]MDE2043679.1 chorismate mutase [Thermoplasmata archaeon]
MLDRPSERSTVSDLAAFRDRIARADRLLVAAIALRLHEVAELQAWKREHLVPAEDRAQERQVFRRARAWALVNDVDPELVEQVLRLVMREGKASIQTWSPQVPTSRPGSDPPR